MPRPLGKSPLGMQYWREEIDYVIKGRGITDFADYADLVRTGRQYGLNVDQRRAVWSLYEAYTGELRAAHVCDYQDVITMAEQELFRKPLEKPYAAVIVDEAQDLSCTMIRMLYNLVGDKPDGFTLIGDGQQSIYPGGYTLAEAGVSVAGRGVVMNVNYRNTAQILEYASRMVADAAFSDIEGDTSHGDAAEVSRRDGPAPVVAECASWNERDRQMVARVEAVVRDVGTGTGDVGVLCRTRAAVARSVKALADAGYPVVELDKYNGKVSDAVKVGTIKRAKGLEFKQVLLPDVQRSHLGDVAPPEEDSARERWEMDRRELYVAMTRARDGLWLGVV